VSDEDVRVQRLCSVGGGGGWPITSALGSPRPGMGATPSFNACAEALYLQLEDAMKNSGCPIVIAVFVLALAAATAVLGWVVAGLTL